MTASHPSSQSVALVESAPSDPAPSASRVKRPLKYIGGPRATKVYGFLLPHESRVHLAKDIKERLYGPLPDMAPEKLEHHLRPTFALVMCTLPSRIYRSVPNAPRVRKHTIVVKSDGCLGDVFALKDDGSHATLEAETSPEDLAVMKGLLYLPPDAQPAWYDVFQAGWPVYC